MKKVVIVGGGFTGAYTAEKLQSNFDVTLVDTKDYYEFTPSILRTLVVPKHLRKMQVLHKDYLKKGNFIRGEVTKISEKAVFLGKEKINFDYLIVASGSRYSEPIKHRDAVSTIRSKEVYNYNKKIKDSKDIAIVGGGLVGVELAAELACKGKNITLISATDRLIERNNEKSSKHCENFLKDRNVKIIYGEKASEKKKGWLTTDKGTKIKSDLVFLCTGIAPNFECLKGLKGALNDKNWAIVNSHLQLGNYENIFAGGDVTNLKEEKTAQSAESHAKIIVKNILRIEKGLPLLNYKSKKRLMVISLGKFDGIIEHNNFILTGLIPALVKWAVEKKSVWKYRIK